jgi:hypothetical protein
MCADTRRVSLRLDRLSSDLTMQRSEGPLPGHGGRIPVEHNRAEQRVGAVALGGLDESCQLCLAPGRAVLREPPGEDLCGRQDSSGTRTWTNAQSH